MKRLETIATSQNRTDLPDFKPGDTVRVHVRVVEGEKERIQVFEGLVISMRGGGNNRTFTVRKVSGGIGVERIFPYNSPMLRTVEVSRKGRVRRSKLYYLRKRVGKRARVREQLPLGSRASAVVQGEAPEDAGGEESAEESTETS
jgi:large subunit ribosomal protein L19